MAEHFLTLFPSNLKQTFRSGTLLSDALLDMGASLHTPCGGKGTCGRCRVRVEDEDRECWPAASPSPGTLP
jgi:Na+-transporting NADH:ubiquinone oxidoreductase subunit NqrF